MINIQDALIIYTPFLILKAIKDGDILIIRNKNGYFLDQKELTSYNNYLYEANSIILEWNY